MKSSISISAKPGVNRSERTESVSEIVAKILLDKGPLILFGLLLLYMALFAPYFLEWQNITTIFRQTVPLSILCFGLATVVVTGGDDVVVKIEESATTSRNGYQDVPEELIVIEKVEVLES